MLGVAEREGGHSYDAPAAEFTHRDGLCSFEVLVEEYGLEDPALALLARIVHGADVAEDRDATPQSRGLLAVAEGFYLLDARRSSAAGAQPAGLRRPLRLVQGRGGGGERRRVSVV